MLPIGSVGNRNLSNQMKMLRNNIANLFSRVFAVILSNDGEKSAARVFVIMLPTVDTRKTLSVVFHYRLGIFAAVDDTQKKLFVRILSVKEALDTHGRGREHNGNVVIVGYFLQDINRNVCVYDHLFVL